MSLFSTTKDDGIVLDLSEFCSIQHDRERHEATLIGGISTKSVAVELAKDGFCTSMIFPYVQLFCSNFADAWLALPSSNPVGAIPFFLNGGNSALISKLAYASDNILSARMITATGELVNISENENADLLYAIRGAGQYFGMIVSLTVRTYPVTTVFGNDEGKFWNGRFVFPLERAQDVAEAMQYIGNDDTYCTGGLIMIAAPPPARKPAVVVIAKLIHPDSETLQETVFKHLYELKPIMAGGGLIRIENNGDALQPLMVSGDFKKLRLTGIHSYDPTMLSEIADLWKSLTTSCPDAATTMFSIQWESQPPIQATFDSANSMHNIRFWANNITWCTDAASMETVQAYLDKVIAVTRKTQKPEDYVDFTNSLRELESPINRRYRGEGRLEHLRMLKRMWDPEGVFGRELL